MSTSPPSFIAARSITLAVVPTGFHPRPRNPPVGEQEQGRAPHLQLRPHKQPQPHLPDLLRLAHPRRAHEGKVPRSSPHPEAFAPPPPRRAGRYCGGRVDLRPILRLWYDGGGCQGAGAILRGGRGGVSRDYRFRRVPEKDALRGLSTSQAAGQKERRKGGVAPSRPKMPSPACRKIAIVWRTSRPGRTHRADARCRNRSAVRPPFGSVPSTQR